jgi:hypothetical protein
MLDTESAEVEDWFRKVLSNTHLPGEVGVLAQVKLPSRENGSLNVTEVLFYEAGDGQTQCPTLKCLPRS